MSTTLERNFLHDDVSNIPKRHPRFYFSDGNVIFLVECNLYKVHRYFFERDSPIFDSMFSLPCPPGHIPEGQVDENPIVLQGIDAKDFDRLLSLLYPQNFQMCEIQAQEEWISILRLATCWELFSLRELAISCLNPPPGPTVITQLSPLPAADRIVLGWQFDLTEWLLPAYTELCVRKEVLTFDEGEKLGMVNVINIVQVRHAIRYASNLNRSLDVVQDLVRERCIDASKCD